MDKSEFERKFKAKIKADTSAWKSKLAADRANRKEFRRSQRVADRILEFLEQNKDWSQKRLAEALDVTPQHISKILKGQANFTLNTIEAMEQVLGVNLLEERPIKTEAQLQTVPHADVVYKEFFVTEMNLIVAAEEVETYTYDGLQVFYQSCINYTQVKSRLRSGETSYALSA
ncbi:MAG: helix-turn-helix transcriptional regulator [Flavobacteriales bacterium]